MVLVTYTPFFKMTIAVKVLLTFDKYENLGNRDTPSQLRDERLVETKL